MTAVIREVLFELKGRKDQLDATLVQTQASLGRTKTQAEGVGGAGDLMGRKWEMGARQIAGATETIARTGKITGEAGKSFLGAASNLALGFGPGGIALGAISIFALAFATQMSKVREESRKTREAIVDDLNKIAGLDSTGLLREYYQLQAGSPFKLGMEDIFAEKDDAERRRRLRERGITQLRQDLDALEAAKKAASGVALSGDAIVTDAHAFKEASDRIKEVSAALDVMGASADEALKRLQDPARWAPAIATSIEKAAEEAAKLSDKAGAAGEKAGEAWAEAFNRMAIRTLGTAGSRAGAEIQEMITRGLELGVDPAQIAQLERWKEQVGLAADAVAALEQAWLDFESGVTLQGGTPLAMGVNALTALSFAIDDARVRMLFLEEGTEGYAKVQKELNDLLEKYRKLTGQDEGKPPKVADPMKETALQLQQAADGALQLAQNLFGAEAGAIGTLRAVSQIAGNLVEAKKAFGEGGTTLGKVSSVLAIFGAISSLLSNEEHKKLVAENTEAIRNLTARAGLLGIGQGGTGAEAAFASSSVGRIWEEFLRRQRELDASSTSSERARARNIPQIAESLGISMLELERIAADYGIELDGSVRSLQQLQRAIDEASGKLAEFGTDLQSQLAQADAYARVFGITDPGALLGLTKGAVGGRSPVLDAALAGLDLSTAEGREAARQALQALFTTMMAGDGALTEAQLGTLGGDELLQAILDLIDGLNAVDEAQGTNTSSVPKADQVITADRTQITADQASRLLGIQTSALAELRIIREALVASRTPLPVPALSAGFSQVGTATIVVNQHVEFNGPMTTRDISQAVNSATVDAMDQALGQRVIIRRRYMGKAVTK